MDVDGMFYDGKWDGDVGVGHVDILDLFHDYCQIYFANSLGACSVEWSKRMVSCAGICYYSKGGGCIIRLSEPILQYRPLTDIKETLLHEMIHAYIRLNGIKDSGPGSHDGHGDAFKAKMVEINAARAPDPWRPPGGYKITVRHTMIAEVMEHKKFIYRCRVCGDTSRRHNRRPPQPADCREYRLAPGKTAGPDLDCHDPACRYHAHQRTCAAGKDGYDLIAQPERQGNGKGAGAGAGGTPKKRKGAGPAPGSPGKGQRTLADFVTAGGGGAGRADEGGAGPPPARPPIDGDGAEHCEADAPFENMRRHAGGTRLLPPPDLDPDEDGAAPRRPPRKRPRPAPPPPPPTVPSATERAVLVAGPGLGPAWPGAPRTLAPSTEHDPSQDIDTRTVVIDPSPAPLDPREAAARAAMRRFGAPRVPMGGGVKGGALRGAEVEAAGGARGPMFGRLPLGRMFTAGPGASSAPTVGLAATAAAARIGAEKGGHGHEIEAQPAESEEIVVIIDDD